MTVMPDGWFERAVRPDQVVSHLVQHLPDFSTGRLALLGCRVTRLRSSEPEGHWTATYLLDVEDRTSRTRRTVAAGGTLIPPGAPDPVLPALVQLGEEGWMCWLPSLRLRLHTEPVDAALPAPAYLQDPDAGTALMERLLRSGGNRDGLRLESCVAEVLSYKPGARATLRCDLDYPPGLTDSAWPRSVIVKVHHDDEAERSHRAMEALWASPLGSSRTVRIAEPIAYDPELRLSAQSALPEQHTLRDLLHSTLVSETPTGRRDLEEALRTTAAGLAELHQSAVDHGRAITFEDELATLRGKRTKLAAMLPWLDERTETMLDRLAVAGENEPPDPVGPAHHSFRPANVLLSPAGAAFIDFDKLCQSEPSSDIASFTTKVRHMCLNKAQDGEEDPDLDVATRLERLARADQIRALFLAEYARHFMVSPRRIVLWEALELFSLVLSAAKKTMRARVDNCLFMVDEHNRVHGL